MGLLGKILCLVACAVGVICTLAPIIVERDRIQSESECDSVDTNLLMQVCPNINWPDSFVISSHTCISSSQLVNLFSDADRFGNKYKGSVACMFIAFFIFLGGLIFLFVTLCCSCSDTCMGILIAVLGGAARKSSTQFRCLIARFWVGDQLSKHSNHMCLFTQIHIFIFVYADSNLYKCICIHSI